MCHQHDFYLIRDYEEEFFREADDLGRLGHDKDEEALMVSYIGGLMHEL